MEEISIRDKIQFGHLYIEPYKKGSNSQFISIFCMSRNFSDIGKPIRMNFIMVERGYHLNSMKTFHRFIRFYYS